MVARSPKIDTYGLNLPVGRRPDGVVALVPSGVRRSWTMRLADRATAPHGTIWEVQQAMPSAELRPDLRGVTLLLHGDQWPGLRPGEQAELQIRRVEAAGLPHQVRVHGWLYDGPRVTAATAILWQASLPATVA